MAELSTIYTDIDNIDAENITQEDLIVRIADALDGKGTAGGGIGTRFTAFIPVIPVAYGTMGFGNIQTSFSAEVTN